MWLSHVDLESEYGQKFLKKKKTWSAWGFKKIVERKFEEKCLTYPYSLIIIPKPQSTFRCRSG
jgi:hypothetical protein